MDKHNLPLTDGILWDLFSQKLLEHIDAEVLVVDSSGTMVFANSRFLDFAGLHKKDILGVNWVTHIIPKDKRPEINTIFKEIKEEKELIKFDSPVVGRDEVKKYLHWIAVALKNERTYHYMFMGTAGKFDSEKEVVKHTLTKQELEKAKGKIIDAIFLASKVTDPGTAEHAFRVMLLSVLLAKKFNLGRENAKRLKIAALLHDLGKLAVDDRILFKNGKLTKKEFEEMKKHPHWGADAIRLICFLKDIIPVMALHHENFDGSGYPEGLSAEEISFEARILSAADMYEALTADRPYRKGFTVAEAAVIIRSERGRKLDPEITDVLLGMIASGELKREGF